jgi:hypothetical protein
VAIWRSSPSRPPWQPQPLYRPAALGTPSSLAAGTASFVSSGPGGISVTATDATGGAAPYTYQWQRNTDGGAYGNLGGATALSVTDATATAGHLYGYKLVYTDNVSNTATSNAVTAQVYSGGSLGGGGAMLVGPSALVTPAGAVA